MGKRFAEIAFTPAVQEQQQHHGSRKQYQRIEEFGETGDRLGPNERAFIAARDGFYMSSVSETGWPYIQFRGGPKGFLHVEDDRTLGFADLSGNKQYITTGNLTKDDRVSLFLMDYPRQRRLKLFGHAQIFEEDEIASNLIARFQNDEKNSRPERAVLIHLEAFDWNCPQHITPRFTMAEFREINEHGGLPEF